MSADVINPFELVNNFANKLPTGDRYGEVFIGQQRAVVLHCSLCNMQYRAYQDFLEHIFAHYYAKKKNSIRALEQQHALEIKEETADIALKEQQISEEVLVKTDNLLVETLAESEEFQVAKETIQENPLAEQNISDVESKTPKPKRKLRKRQETLQECQQKAKTKKLNNSHYKVEKACKVEATLKASILPTNDHFETTPANLLAKQNSVDATENFHTRHTTSPVPEESSDSSKSVACRKNQPKLKTKKSGNDDQTLTCETCGCTFKNSSNLRAHTLRHTGQKPFACVQCQMGFYTRSELASHELRRHSEHRPFVCVYCGLGCVSKSTLSLHERKHSANLPHVCSVCGKAFLHAFRLRNHMPVHTRERKHVCSVCNATFAHRKVLGVHMKLHLNAREYACDLCGMSFNQKPTMLLHKKSKHNVIISSHATAKAHQGSQPTKLPNNEARVTGANALKTCCMMIIPPYKGS